MKFHRQKIKDLILIEPEPYTDRRGLFRRVFCSNELKINFNIKQANISENKDAQTLRGFHYQKNDQFS